MKSLWLIVAILFSYFACNLIENSNNVRFLYYKNLLESTGPTSLIIYNGKYGDSIKEYRIDVSRFRTQIQKKYSSNSVKLNYSNSFIDSLVSNESVFNLDTISSVFSGNELFMDSTSNKIFNFSEDEIIKYYFQNNVLNLNFSKANGLILTNGVNGNLTIGEFNALIKFLFEHNYFVSISDIDGKIVINKFSPEK